MSDRVRGKGEGWFHLSPMPFYPFSLQSQNGKRDDSETRKKMRNEETKGGRELG